MSDSLTLEATCRNCDANLGRSPANFCSACGQDTLNHPPTFWEFVHEFITHYVALEGKLWKTLWLLFFKPAELTREYREGRKQRYISPLRLYITASFLFFLVVKVAGWGNLVNIDLSNDPVKKKEVAVALGSAKNEIANSLKEAKKEIAAATDVVGDEKIKLNAKLERAASLMDGAVGKANAIADGKTVSGTDGNAKAAADGVKAAKENADKSQGDDSINVADFNCADGEKICAWLKDHLEAKYKGKTQTQVLSMLRDGAIANIPYAMFMLLPLFALLTKILYINRGYYYGEHVVYALHIHAFTFFVMLMSALLPDWLAAAVLIAAAIYYLVALQRFFGGNWFLTFIRYGVIGTLYPVMLSVVATVVLLFIAIV